MENHYTRKDMSKIWKKLIASEKEVETLKYNLEQRIAIQDVFELEEERLEGVIEDLVYQLKDKGTLHFIVKLDEMKERENKILEMYDGYMLGRFSQNDLIVGLRRTLKE